MDGLPPLDGFHGQPAAGKDLEHATVFREDLRHETGQALFAGDQRQVLQENTGDPLAMVVFLDGERHLCGPQWAGLVDDGKPPAPDDHLVLSCTDRNRQRDRVLEIELGGRFQLRIRQRFFVVEESGVDRFGIQFFEGLEESRLVVRPDRTDSDFDPVLERCRLIVVGCVDHAADPLCR